MLGVSPLGSGDALGLGISGAPSAIIWATSLEPVSAGGSESCRPAAAIGSGGAYVRMINKKKICLLCFLVKIVWI